MPINYNNYPADWHTNIRPRILEREDHRCKQCGVRNKADLPTTCCAKPHYNEKGKCQSCGRRRPRVVLTIAHLDHDITNNNDDNLAALCQRCHLTYDAKHHAANARKTRQRKKASERPRQHGSGDSGMKNNHSDRHQPTVLKHSHLIN